MTSLWKLLGTIEALPYGFLGLHAIAIPVDQVKRLRSKLLKGEKTIAGISYQPGKGWYYQEKKISTHGLDAYLVYFIWKSKGKSELVGKSIGEIKIERNYKEIEPIEDEEPELPEDDEPIICWEPDELEEIEDHD